MEIIGYDMHSRNRQIALLKSEIGELAPRRLANEGRTENPERMPPAPSR
jgi:hypothetical protein